MPDEARLARLPLAFRVGVTGTRALDAAALPRLRTAVALVLELVRADCAAIAREPSARMTRAAAEAATAKPRLTLLSSLAVGADRLVAQVAIDHGYDLTAVLPFAEEEYVRDFPESAEEFAALLRRAAPRVLALDGRRGGAEWRSYEAAGRVVVRHCDLLIAIWDNEVPAQGRGGTEDTMKFALASGRPVWWIHASGTRPGRFLTGPLVPADLTETSSTPDPEARLRAYIEARLGSAGNDRDLPDRVDPNW